MTPDEIRRKLLPYNLRKVSDATGQAYITVCRFVGGKTVSPSHKLISALEAFLKEQAQ